MSAALIEYGELRYYRHGEAFWHDLISRQEKSGQGVRKFCQANGVASSTFHKWRAALAARGKAAENAAVMTPDAAFIPILHEQDMPADTKQAAASQPPIVKGLARDSVVLTIAGMRVELNGAHADRVVRHLLGRLGSAKC
jgi:transposase-like protein